MLSDIPSAASLLKKRVSARLLGAVISIGLLHGVLASAGQLDENSRIFEQVLTRGRSQIGSNPASALESAKEASLIAERLPKIHQSVALARVAWLQATALVAEHRANDAAFLVKKVLANKAQLQDSPKVLGDLYMALATANSLLGNTEPALYGLQDAFRFYKRAGNNRGQSLALQNIGIIFSLAHDFRKALDYYNQAELSYAADRLIETALLNNRGNALKELGNTEGAERDLNKAARLAEAAGNFGFQSQILSNLASAQLLAGKIEAARSSVAHAFTLTKYVTGGTDPFLLGVAAATELRSKRLKPALQLIRAAFARSGSATPMILRRYLERTAYEIGKSQGDHASALSHLEEYQKLDDQVRAVAASANAALMSSRFDFANQNARIAQLRQHEAEQQATIQRNRVRFQSWLLGGAALIVGLLLVGVISIRRSRDQVRAANDELTGTNAELQHALAARTEFLATTSHEIRTPLNGILGMTQVLLADRALEAGVKEKIELVKGAGETMKALVDDILDVAKIANGELSVHRAEMDPRRLLREAAQVWEAQASTKQVAIRLDMADLPHRIVEDEVRLRQIVFNLMANAVKFTDRGSVRLAAEIVADADMPATSTIVAPSGYILRIAVSDTGIGIPADRLDDIFESFRQVDGGTTRRHGGTGLGLSICRNLAQLMGGDVRVASILGGGSTFTLELPCMPVAAPAAQAVPETLAGTRLLLLDGNPLARSVMTALLAPHAARIVPVGDLEAAQGAIGDDAIDLVLADAAAFGIDMGRVAAFAGRHPAVRIVLLWPSPDEATCRAADAAGILRIVAKPIAAPELIVALKDIYMVDRRPEEIAA